MKSLFPSDFSGQFILSKTPIDRPDAQSHALASLHLGVFDPLAVVTVTDAQDRPIGAFLGLPIDYEGGALLRDSHKFSEALGDDIDQFIETHVYGLGGSFIFILDTGTVRRVYLDACGSLSAVYDPDMGAVAATSPLLVTPQDADARLRHELYEFLKVDRDGWFPAGMTAHEGVHRLMPNFYLDLDTWATKRHWPTAQITREADPDAVCATIGQVVRKSISTILNGTSATMALTAGNETRILTACAKGMTDGLTFVTVDAKGSELDRTRACDIAERFGLTHELLPLRHADEAGAQDWRARAGQAFGGPHPYTHPTIKPLEKREVFIGGLGGEIGRAFFWRPTDTADTQLDAASIAARLGMPIHDTVIAAIEKWMPSVAGFDAFQTLDLAYLELRMGCWGFALSYCSPRPVDLHPLIAREAFTAMMALPPEWRRMEGKTNRMIQSIVKQNWPELLDLPISRYGDYRDQLHFVKRVVSQPNLVFKRLRKRFG